MRLNGVPDLRVTVTPLPGHQPPRIRLMAGPFMFVLAGDEARALADRLHDAADVLEHPNRKDNHR